MDSLKSFSVSASVLFHSAVFLFLLLFVKFTANYPQDKYVELSFGNTGLPGSSGAIGNQLDDVAQVSKKQEVDQTKDKSEDVKKMDLPKAADTQTEDVIKTAEKKKEKKVIKKKDDVAANSNVNAEGKGNRINGTGSFGYDIDWGGQGQRKIYSYILPAYPEGVDKEIDIRLRFSIMPDGTVGTIIPLIKADTRLESAAINSLRQWRFEPLAPDQKKLEQTAVIVFPYRLR